MLSFNAVAIFRVRMFTLVVANGVTASVDLRLVDFQTTVAVQRFAMGCLAVRVSICSVLYILRRSHG